MAAKPKDNELRLTRVFDAPVQAVWDAWNDPQQVAQWWGPRGFTITHISKDLRPGGHWKYTMHGPDGVDYPNRTVYHEVVPLQKLVYDHGGTEDTPPLFRVTVLFTERDGKTHLDMTMTLATAWAAKATADFIKKAGGESTWDRLAEYLAHTGAHKEQFVIARSFDTTIDRMFEMWTDPKHFVQWLPPTGMTMQFIRADIRPGGVGFFSMTDGKSVTMFGRVHYCEIRRPDRLVYMQEFVDEHENVSRHPFAPTWPAAMLTTVQFEEEWPGRTRVSITWEPTGPTTAEEMQMFIKERAGMTQGWSGSFEKLEALLA
ncbi:MAG: SRPBCC family protein [Tepidisphaeraceae bacterium]